MKVIMVIYYIMMNVLMFVQMDFIKEIKNELNVLIMIFIICSNDE